MRSVVLRWIGLIGAGVCLLIFAYRPSFPTPDKLLVFLALLFMGFQKGKALLWRLAPFMALLLAVLRTLVDELLDAPELMRRLNLQICRHSPGSRFITLFYAEYTPATGRLVYVNAGQTPPLIRRADGSFDRCCMSARAQLA